MTKNIWLNVDLDYFNFSNDPLGDLDDLLCMLDPSILCAVTVEHHTVLKHLKRVVRDGVLKTPFNVIHVDQHHDFYYNSLLGKVIDCGNFMHSLPLDKCESITWFQNTSPEEADWDDASRMLLKKKGIITRKTKIKPWEEKKINWKKIRFVTFTISPDYCEDPVLANMMYMTEEIERKFDLPHMVKRDTRYAWDKVQGYKVSVKTKKLHLSGVLN